MKRHDKAPNGHFAEGLILYGNLETGAMASHGFLLEPPDLQHASIGLQNDFQDKTVTPKKLAHLRKMTAEGVARQRAERDRKK